MTNYLPRESTVWLDDTLDHISNLYAEVEARGSTVCDRWFVTDWSNNEDLREYAFTGFFVKRNPNCIVCIGAVS